MIKYRVGDKVKAVDDDTTGIVISVTENEIVIENEFGFEESYLPNELLPDVALEAEFEVEEERPIIKKKQLSKTEKEQKKKVEFQQMVDDNFAKNSEQYRQKLEQRYKKEIKVSKKKKGTFVLDLHYGKLENYSAQLPIQHILKRQINAAISGIEKARNEGYAKIILVHGKGKGVLETEVKKYLDAESYTHYDADFRQYKLGATEVEL